MLPPVIATQERPVGQSAAVVQSMEQAFCVVPSVDSSVMLQVASTPLNEPQDAPGVVQVGVQLAAVASPTQI